MPCSCAAMAVAAATAGGQMPVIHHGKYVPLVEALELGTSCDREGCRVNHLGCYRSGTRIEHPSEQTREDQGIVELIVEAAASGGDDSRARVLRLLGPDLGDWISTRKDDRVGRHGPDPVGTDDVGTRG